MALYKTGKSFNIFENEGWAAWYYKMNPVWKIPLAKLFRWVLLTKIYEKIKINIYAPVDTYIYVNFGINSSSNIGHKKIVTYLFTAK